MYHDYTMSKEETQKLLERSKLDIGKHLFAVSKDEGATRLFIRSCSATRETMNKHGWWETFTISKKPCKTGTYICKILDFRLDSKGYLNCVVDPVIQILDRLDTDWESSMRYGDNRAGLAVLFNSGMFSERYLATPLTDRFNVEALITKYGQEIFKAELPTRDEYHQLYTAVTQQVLEGKTTITEITEILRTPTRYEVAAFELEKEAAEVTNSHPLMVKRALNIRGNHGFLYVHREIVNLVEDKAMEYKRLASKRLVDDGITPPLNQAEVAMCYWDNVHKAQKAAKIAAKKAKKG